MKKFFPYIILGTALLISCTGSYFSIYGLGKFYGGHQTGATILAFSIEFGNIITAASLKLYWKFLPNLLKLPLIVVVIGLTALTSFGIYGYLSDGYQKTAMKDEVVTKKSNLVNIKKNLYQDRVNDNKKELASINTSMEELTKSYNVNTQTEQIDKRTGQKITNVIVGNKKGLDNQLNLLNNRKVKLDSINSNFLDSIQRLELQVIELQANNDAASELGPLKYLSTLIDVPMNRIANWITLSISIAFQPLALMLILTSMFAFKNNHYLNRSSSRRKKEPVKVLESIKNSTAGLFKSIKDKFSTKPKDVISSQENKTSVTPIPEKKKRKSRKKIEESQIESDTIKEDIPNQEIVESIPPIKKPRKRRVVDTNLTADIADHIQRSLTDKKK